MKKTKNMIDKVTTLRWMPLLMALFFASCQSDDLTIPTDVPQGMKIVTVDFQLPEGKPAFGEGETRATTTNGTWANGDELLMTLAVRNINEEISGGTSDICSASARLTLVYDGAAWDVNEAESYSVTAKGDVITAKPYAQLPLLTASQNLSLTSLTLMLDENFGEVDEYFVQVIYAPDVKRVVSNEGTETFQLKTTATTTAPEWWQAYAIEDNASLILQWQLAFTARLRVYTGAPGDVVTLTSAKFSPILQSLVNDTYTATTDKDGNAYFYGTMAQQTDDFILLLTAISGKELTPSMTLLEASPLVPVTLTAGTSYKLDAKDKRAEVTSDN